MQKDVILFMASRQAGGAIEEDRVEVITAGQYYKKNGAHFVVYEELSEDGRTAARNMIKIRNGKTEVIKNGEASVHMVFELHKKNFSYYDMPYGKMMVGLETERMDCTEEEDRLSLLLQYRLEVDYQYMADCTVEIRIESKDTCEIKLG